MILQLHFTSGYGILKLRKRGELLMAEMKPLPIGVEDFKELIEKEYMENPTLEIDSSSEHELEPASNFDKTMDFLEYLNKDDEK